MKFLTTVVSSRSDKANFFFLGDVPGWSLTVVVTGSFGMRLGSFSSFSSSPRSPLLRAPFITASRLAEPLAKFSSLDFLDEDADLKEEPVGQRNARIKKNWRMNAFYLENSYEAPNTLVCGLGSSYDMGSNCQHNYACLKKGFKIEVSLVDRVCGQNIICLDLI